MNLILNLNRLSYSRIKLIIVTTFVVFHSTNYYLVFHLIHQMILRRNYCWRLPMVQDSYLPSQLEDLLTEIAFMVKSDNWVLKGIRLDDSFGFNYRLLSSFRIQRMVFLNRDH
jgi:hypothetical protein